LYFEKITNYFYDIGLENSILRLKNAIQNDSSEHIYYKVLGLIYEKEKRINDAIELYSEFIRNFPDSDFPWKLMGEFCISIENFDPIFSVLEELVAENTKFHGYLWKSLPEKISKEISDEQSLDYFIKIFKIAKKKEIGDDLLSKISENKEMEIIPMIRDIICYFFEINEYRGTFIYENLYNIFLDKKDIAGFEEFWRDILVWLREHPNLLEMENNIKNLFNIAYYQYHSYEVAFEAIDFYTSQPRAWFYD